MKYTVETGKRYAARVSLSWIESVASNDMIAEKFEAAGFEQVNVTGSGSERIARGTWNKESASAELPSQITEVAEIDPI